MTITEVSTAQAYLLKAAECARLATEADDPAVRAAFEKAADGWRLLAANQPRSG